jgi:hypothetical protein
MKLKPEFKELLDAAKGQGWQVIVRTNNHLAWVSPAGPKVFSSRTPSDHRAIKNLKRDLKNNGMQFKGG